MESIQEFHDELARVIPLKSDHLERSAIVRLRENVQGFETGVTSMYDFLIDKGLLQNDPYKSERSVTEIQVPSSAPFTDGEAVTEMSGRFSQYVSQWEFLVNIYHVSISMLSLKKIKRLLDLIDWIRWTDFSPNSGYQVTRAIARIVARVSKMNDPMAGKIMSSTAAHLRDRSHDIRKELKVVTEFLREAYKWKIRDEVVSKMTIDSTRYSRHASDILDNIKFEVTHLSPKPGWYRELVQELLEEDYGSNAAALRREVLNRLKVAEQQKKKKVRKGPDDKALLMAVIEKLARCSEPIRSALVKLNENSRSLQDRKRSFGERLSEIFSTLFSRSEGKTVYDITIRDPVTGAVRHESIDYQRFSGLAAKRARTLQELQEKNSAAHQNARGADTDKLEDYITRFMGEVKTIHRRLDGLDAYFKSNNIPPELKGSMKPCSLNVKNLKAAIAETIRTFNDYKIKKEEREQLAKLGIED